MESVQPQLFEPSETTVDIKTVLLYALGEFQSRGHELANRELALDRLHGAFLRASQKFGLGELSDESVIKGLKELGVIIVERPAFVAKRPFRVSAPESVCNLAISLFEADA